MGEVRRRTSTKQRLGGVQLAPRCRGKAKGKAAEGGPAPVATPGSIVCPPTRRTPPASAAACAPPVAHLTPPRNSVCALTTSPVRVAITLPTCPRKTLLGSTARPLRHDAEHASAPLAKSSGRGCARWAAELNRSGSRHPARNSPKIGSRCSSDCSSKNCCHASLVRQSLVVLGPG
jgi:hypothetical protein